MSEAQSVPAPAPRRRRAWLSLSLLAVAVLVGVGRELGYLDLSLNTKTTNSKSMVTGARSTNAETEMRPRPDGTPLADRGGLAIFAPQGAFTDAVLTQLPHFPDLTGFVECVYEPPSSWIPLRKTATQAIDVYAELDLRRDGKPPVHSKFHFHLDGEWQVLGLCATRDFVTWVGTEVGESLHESVTAELDVMRKL